ncbi:MAG: methanogenesis marker 2 protein [Archaeoglobi archaeon]|nr:methanogenesis marker 2 protein [Candidatus Mnemosynella sp.]
MELSELISEIRSFEGIKRKRFISPLVKRFLFDNSRVIASFGEDAAVIDFGEEVLLLAADGIWDKLMKADPEWAGYCAVLVNIHDIAAMGGEPVAMVDVLSVSSAEKCLRVSRGIQKAVEKFGVPVVGGHVHPDTSYDALDIAILGKAKKNSLILSSTAEKGDLLIYAVDLHGRIHPSFPFNWDSTTLRSSDELKKQIECMKILGENRLVTAGKDVSNSGLLGTIGMLLETSVKGAVVNLESIPKPEEISLSHWLKVYPGMGFILTAKDENADEILKIFQRVKMRAEVIGFIQEEWKLEVEFKGEKRVLFSFPEDSVTGLRGSRC